MTQLETILTAALVIMHLLGTMLIWDYWEDHKHRKNLVSPWLLDFLICLLLWEVITATAGVANALMMFDKRRK